MNREDRIETQILTFAALVNSYAKANQAESSTPAVTGLFDYADAKALGNREAALLAQGFLGQTGGLTDKGQKRLLALRQKVASGRDGLERTILEVFGPVAGKEQTAAFRQRLADGLALIRRMQDVSALGPPADCLEADLVLHLKALLDQPTEQLVGDAFDLVDLAGTQAVSLWWGHRSPGAPARPDPADVTWEKIGRGFFHGHLETQVSTGPLRINLMRVDPKHYRLVAVDCTQFDESVRSLERLCRDFDAVGGTSGGFFLCPELGIEPPSKRGDPIGLVVAESRVLHPPVFARPALIMDERGHAFIRVYGMKGVTVTIGNAVFRTRKVNAVPAAGEIAVLTSLFGVRTPDKKALHVSIVGRQVVEVADRSVAIPLNGFAVVVNSGPAPLGDFARIAPDDTVDYSLPAIKGIEPVVAALAGGPSLVQHGRKSLDFEAEQFGPGIPPVPFHAGSSMADALHPRLAWGITPGYELIGCAVEGRDLDRSVGMSLGHLARWMKQLGCVDVLNLDGGASVRMVVKDREVGPVLSGRSAGGESRPMATALLIKPV